MKIALILLALLFLVGCTSEAIQPHPVVLVSIDSIETTTCPDLHLQNRSACVDACGDGVCQKRTCLGSECPCAESYASCQDCVQ